MAEILKEVLSSGKNLVLISGAVSADTPEGVRANRARLAERAKRVAKKLGDSVRVVCNPLLFPDEKLERMGDTEKSDWVEFWNKIFCSGKLTDVYFTPGWEKSSGARWEHEKAEELGLTMHYLEM